MQRITAYRSCTWNNGLTLTNLLTIHTLSHDKKNIHMLSHDKKNINTKTSTDGWIGHLLKLTE